MIGYTKYEYRFDFTKLCRILFREKTMLGYILTNEERTNNIYDNKGN